MTTVLLKCLIRRFHLFPKWKKKKAYREWKNNINLYDAKQKRGEVNMKSSVYW